jgi:hypothetical protein
MIDIDDNSHSWLYPPLLKTAQVELIGGWVTRIALFHLLTIKNDPAAIFPAQIWPDLSSVASDQRKSRRQNQTLLRGSLIIMEL